LIVKLWGNTQAEPPLAELFGAVAIGPKLGKGRTGEKVGSLT